MSTSTPTASPHSTWHCASDTSNHNDHSLVRGKGVNGIIQPLYDSEACTDDEDDLNVIAIFLIKCPDSINDVNNFFESAVGYVMIHRDITAGADLDYEDQKNKPYLGGRTRMGTWPSTSSLQMQKTMVVFVYVLRFCGDKFLGKKM